jgi:hypothetical protein
MIDLIQPKYREECLLTVFGEEAIALSGFVKSSITAENVSFCRELLTSQQYIFDTLWNKSIPADDKIKEIEL